MTNWSVAIAELKEELTKLNANVDNSNTCNTMYIQETKKELDQLSAKLDHMDWCNAIRIREVQGAIRQVLDQLEILTLKVDGLAAPASTSSPSASSALVPVQPPGQTKGIECQK